MNLQRCPNGHFYDADKYPRCPHCDGSLNGAPVGAPSSPAAGNTVSFNPVSPSGAAESGATVTMPFGSGMTPNAAAQSQQESEEKTVSFFNIKNEKGAESFDPVVGWLVCVDGKHVGMDFRLTVGRNFIGRTRENAIALEGEDSVSRSKHAVVVFEPTQNMFLAQPGESSELFYVNGAVVLNTMPIKKNDRLKIGKVELMLIPCCDDCFNWNPNEVKK